MTDASGNQTRPSKTLQSAYLQHDEKVQCFSKSALKKAASYADIQKKKAGKKEEEDRKKALEEARKIVVKPDPTLPKAARITPDKERVEVVKLASEDHDGIKTEDLGRKTDSASRRWSSSSRYKTDMASRNSRAKPSNTECVKLSTEHGVCQTFDKPFKGLRYIRANHLPLPFEQPDMCGYCERTPQWLEW